MKKQNAWQRTGAVSLFLLVILSACGFAPPATPTTPQDPAPATPSPFPLDPTYAAQIAELRDPEVPDLPFPDNPDPTQCGIPTEWGLDEPAYLTGIYDGEMVQPTVLLYDSHSRFNITARAPHGSKVTVILYQQNPVIDYYFVRIVDGTAPNEGWVPAPFLSFEPVEPIG